MKRKFKIVSGALLLSAIAATNSCTVNELYSWENIKDSLNSDLTLFENGISVPLVQNSAKIRVDSLVRQSGIDTTAFGSMLKVAEDGTYYIEYTQAISMDETLADLDLQNAVKIKGLDFSENFAYSIGDINADNLRLEAQEFNQSAEIQSIELTYNFEGIEQSQKIVNKETLNTAGSAAILLGQSSATLPDVNIDVDIPAKNIEAFSLPSQVREVKSVKLKSGAAIKVSVSIPDCILDAGSINPGLVADLSDVLTLVDGTSTLNLASLVLNKANNFSASADFYVASINAAKFTQSKTVTFSGSFSISNAQLNAQTAKDAASDIAANIRIDFVNFDIDEAICDIEGVSYPFDIPETVLKYSLPNDLANFGTFEVLPKNNPKLEIVINAPSSDILNISVGNGIKVKVPDFIVLGELPAGFVFNAEDNSFVLNNLNSNSYQIPIEKLVLVPQKDGDSYCFESSYYVSGTAVLAEGDIDICKLSSLSGQTFGVSARIPQLEAQSISVSELAFDVDQTVEFSIMPASDIPEMLVALSEIAIDNVNAALDLQIRNLPDIGSGKYMVDVVVELPDFVKPSNIVLDGEIASNGIYSKTIPVEGLDFSKVDFAALRANGSDLKGEVKVKGRVLAENPSVNLDNIHSDISAVFKASIGDAEGNIKVKSVVANVDYQVDTLVKVPFFSLPENLKDCSLDLPDFNLEANVTSNLSIPASATIDICNGEYELNMAFPYAQTPEEMLTANNKYKLDLDGLFAKQIDSLDVKLKLNLDSERHCTIYTDAEYALDLDLNLSAPLQLGENFALTYSDTLALGESADMLKSVLAETSAGLKATVDNTLPLNVNVKIEFLAQQEDESFVVADIAPVETELVKAGQSSQVQLVIKANEGADLSRLSHLRFSVTLGASGQTLAEDSAVQLSAISLVLPEGITINPSALAGGDETENQK